ncbi:MULTISPECIES: sigma-70 family RNA polymerase sigma factor [Sphingomonas]|uniref:RNA polymerase sigma factor n=1 Tax=Sphingomonas glacialis TaxID=658225 RepID=A0ABQ3LN89_9SPHN|nr:MULTISPECIES: sigma-70 family RNA polymerase sigma factor [Sphingomonas]MDY7524194.1 sigma-70 family RNA polymerase sigma factor [Sphingomonas sp. 10B4]MEB0281974.1 sigma-70 family RNA polymerase sigma factor [Sphingomonas sp. 10B4]GHH18195.1 RNA polymerase sigma factor [Sphingomonas glacialis]
MIDSTPRASVNSAAGTPEAARLRLVETLVRTGEEDRAAFRDLYSLTSAKLFGICYRICGERQAAEDVLHDVYLTIWKRAGAYEPARASPITWLATIARNRAIDWQRAQTVRRASPIEDAPPILDTAPLASDVLLEAESTHQLHACLDSLEERQRAAIRTAFFDGVTYAELAEREAVPLGTMKSWVRRGLARLKACLEG